MADNARLGWCYFHIGMLGIGGCFCCHIYHLCDDGDDACLFCRLYGDDGSHLYACVSCRHVTAE